MVGIDVVPSQPPRGVSTLQGDFLSPTIREEMRRFVQEPMNGRANTHQPLARHADSQEGATEERPEDEDQGYIDLEKAVDSHSSSSEAANGNGRRATSTRQVDVAEGRVVDVVLSDMSEPWPLTTSTWIRSVSNPYRRMMNTSGITFKDHAGSMVRGKQTPNHARIYG